MTEQVVQATEPRWRTIHQYAGRQVCRLQTGYLQKLSSAKSDLAQLRKVDPTRDERLLAAWEAVFVSPPESLIGYGDEPTDTERVLVTALHLYAVHQQSKSDPMHMQGVGLGAAIRRLANPTDADNQEKPVMRRYHALTTATELSETVQHLRGLVSQMRAAGVALDYGQLASDLYLLQRASSRARVRLAWARDLTRPAKKPAES